MGMFDGFGFGGGFGYGMGGYGMGGYGKMLHLPLLAKLRFEARNFLDIVDVTSIHARA